MSDKTDQVKGRGKEAVGALTGNEDLQREGKAERQAGEAKQKVGDAARKVDDVLDVTKDHVEGVIAKAKHATLQT
jgi:uncharacterized protein YjbJ (UPF0337 family)